MRLLFLLVVAVQGFIITATIKDVEDFHGLSNAIGNDRAALERNGSQTFLQVITRPSTMRCIANPGSEQELLEIVR